MDISIPYYEDMSRISNSNIGWFLKKGPRYLKDMLDGKIEGLKASFLDKGTMIHEYILQPEEFWNDYIILDFAVPKVKQQKDLLEFYSTARLTDPFATEEDILLMSYNAAYSNNKSIDKRIQEARELVELYKNYIEYFRNKDNKKIISFADLALLKTIKQNMQEHKKANEILFAYPETFEVHNEFHINWEFPNASKLGDFPCKSLLDRVMFDHVNKKIILIDLKTTSDVYNFKHSVEEFDYYRQITYYLLAISWYMKDQGIDISDYDCEAYIIAIQTNGNNEVRVFNMFNELELDDRKDLIVKTLTELSYHYQTGNWDHTRKYYENDGIEELRT